MTGLLSLVGPGQLLYACDFPFTPVRSIEPQVAAVNAATSMISSRPGFYLDLVNQAYAQGLPTPITATDLNPHDPRIVRQRIASEPALSVASALCPA